MLGLEAASPRKRWFWTASDDKAMIWHVRANPVYDSGFWNRAGEAAGGRTGACAKWRWTRLRKKGVPLPDIIYRRRRKWSDEFIADILARCRGSTNLAVGRELGLSKAVIDWIVLRYGRAETPIRKSPLTDQERADIALAEKAWKEFEKSQAVTE